MNLVIHLQKNMKEVKKTLKDLLRKEKQNLIMQKKM
jgi:hypothetical protein